MFHFREGKYVNNCWDKKKDLTQLDGLEMTLITVTAVRCFISYSTNNRFGTSNSWSTTKDKQKSQKLTCPPRMHQTWTNVANGIEREVPITHCGDDASHCSSKIRSSLYIADSIRWENEQYKINNSFAHLLLFRVTETIPACIEQKAGKQNRRLNS